MINLAMVILLPMLMAYSLIGETFHEVAGSLIFVLFIAHLIMHREWWKALPKGRYDPRRIFQTALNLLLLIWMFAQPVSGILMSKHLYTFIRIPGIAVQTRMIHLVLAYWGFVLLCIHAGTHLVLPLKKLKQRSSKGWTAAVCGLSAVSIYGIRAFVQRQIGSYMLYRSAFVFFDTGEPIAVFFFDYLAVMILFAFIGYLITIALTKAGKQEENEKRKYC